MRIIHIQTTILCRRSRYSTCRDQTIGIVNFIWWEVKSVVGIDRLTAAAGGAAGGHGVIADLAGTVDIAEVGHLKG